MKPEQYDFKQAAYQRLKQQASFQNVFDFPDFIEMRPVIREAVHQVAADAFDKPVLPVKVERMTLQLEEQLERETRKYQQQNGVYPNQQGELGNLLRLYTNILQVISKRPIIDQEIEDIIYAVNQTRLSLGRLSELTGTGPLYQDNHDQELVPHTFYYLIASQLIRPYLINPQGALTPTNVNPSGKQLMVKLTTYAFRDWDAYLTHQYDEQHNIKNEQGLTTVQYYDALEQNELKYADHAYANVLADVYQDLEKLIVPDYIDRLDIMSTNIDTLFDSHPLLRIKFNQLVHDHFLVDHEGKEHVMDAPLKDIRQKYQYYRKNFS
ncbi:hypothetical protein [Limosilactobacillus caccae]|uniref:hypothetical protein n=1 Tax=Limosilactobacillus caccae TaxID=1926284 RepID=UPI0009712B4F|nr:hypothetical protein [Limosilactobacillus caccae]